jgi:hypothetical protein
MSSSLMRIWQWTPSVVEVGAGAVVGVGAEAEELLQGASLERYYREYAAYFMHDRNPPTNNTFTYGKRLYQEWVVDRYSK